MLSYKRRQLGNEQHGDRSIQLLSTTNGTSATTVEGVPVVAREPRTSQQELEGLDMQEVFHGEGSVEDANDRNPVLPVARLSKCPQSL